jgi:hypothetical protein
VVATSVDQLNLLSFPYLEEFEAFPIQIEKDLDLSMTTSNLRTFRVRLLF